ncbi:MAG: HAMP domain-containing histidine kinase [Proteobacteria bacterium]|nr:HAMP domain-containing histidine kinase [Pseudomonadota bacterium]
MDSFFAPAQRATPTELATEIEIVSRYPVVSGLLQAINGLMAVVDEHRQIVALNNSFLNMLGIDDPDTVLGLRPGEALKCLHAQDGPAGCGTTRFCSTCGAAIAMVASLGQDMPVERTCALMARRGETVVDIFMRVHSHPITIAKKRFLLLFLQDISQEQQWAALERTFFHDVNNMLNMLVGASELLLMDQPSDLAGSVHQVSLRLKNEIAIQSSLSQNKSKSYQPIWQEFSSLQIRDELQSFFSNNPLAHEKKIDFIEPWILIYIRTDISLLLRVLCNMIINALEATDKHGVVKIRIELRDRFLTFYVMNEKEIPQSVSHRIFQRNFSTKESPGRGIGTFSMKLFGETILGGQVSFTSSKEEGTIFKFSHPGVYSDRLS